MSRLPEWVFDPVPPSGRSFLGNSGAKNFRFDIGTVVREATQNSNDARRQDLASPARLDFMLEVLDEASARKFLELSGMALLMERAAAVLDSWPSELPELEAGLRRLKNLKSLPLLIISDSGTTGLRGSDDDTGGSFHAFTLGDQLSAEKSTSSGGSHGLGKSTFWDHSALGTILLSTIGSPRSTPNEWDDRLRVFGRANLGGPHKFHNQRFDKEAWFGLEDARSSGTGAKSFEPEAGLASSLRLAREPGDSGLTIVIPGIRVGGHADNYGEDDLYGGVGSQKAVAAARGVADDIMRAAVEAVWPAIMWRRIEITVRHKIGMNSSKATATPEDLAGDPDFKHFVTLGRLMADGGRSTSRSLDEGHVWATVRHGIPATSKGVTKERAHQRLALDAPLLVTRGELGQATKIYAVRGNGLTISREPAGAASGRGIRAVLLVGLAAKAAGFQRNVHEDEFAETFFKTCESPAHDHWTSEIKKVGETYQQGTWTALRDLRDTCRRQIEQLLLGEDPEPDEHATWTNGLIKLPGGPTPGAARAYAEYRGDRHHPTPLSIRFGVKLHFPADIVKDGEAHILRIGPATEDGALTGDGSRLSIRLDGDQDAATPLADGYGLCIKPTATDLELTLIAENLPVPADRMVLGDPQLGVMRPGRKG